VRSRGLVTRITAEATTKRVRRQRVLVRRRAGDLLVTAIEQAVAPLPEIALQSDGRIAIIR
jgi:hypothetical protein